MIKNTCSKFIPPPAPSKGRYVKLLGLFSLFTIHFSFAQTTINISNRNGVFKFTSSTGDFESITLATPVVFKILNSETALRQLCIINEGYDTVVNYTGQMLQTYFQNHTDKKITVTKEGVVTGMNMIAGKRVTVPFAILLNLGGGKKYAQRIGTDQSNHDAKDTATGIAYYDAFMLARLLQKEDYKGIALLWKHYGPVADMRSNPFLDSAAVEKVNSVRGVEPGEIATSFSFASLNEFGVTAINDAQYRGRMGAGKFGKSFFKKMKSFLGKHDEYKVLFPETNTFINNMKGGDYGNMLDGLRQSYYNDMSNMVVDLNQFVNLPQYQNLIQAFPEIRMTLRTAKVVSEMSETKDLKHPDVIMHELAAVDEWTSLDSNLLNSWRLLDIVSQTLHSRSQEMTWVSYHDFSELASNDGAMKMYMALIYERARGIAFNDKGGKMTVQRFLQGQANTKAFADMCENFLLMANRLDKTIDDDGTKEDNKTLVANDIYLYINQAMDMVQYGFAMANNIKAGMGNDPCIALARNAEDLYRDISTKCSGAEITSLYSFIAGINILANSQVEKYNATKRRLDELTSKKQLTGNEDMEKEILTEEIARMVQPSVIQNALKALSDIAPPILKYGI